MNQPAKNACLHAHQSSTIIQIWQYIALDKGHVNTIFLLDIPKNFLKKPCGALQYYSYFGLWGTLIGLFGTGPLHCTVTNC